MSVVNGGPTPSLAGRSVLVTGVSGGIGSALAKVLGREGAFVVGTYRSRAAEARAVLEAAAPDRHALLEADITSGASARELWDRANAIRPVDTVVLNAAVMMRTPLQGPVAEWDDGWEASMTVNAVAPAALMRQAAHDLAERSGGSIIVISSWAAEQGSRLPEASAYAASKAAVRNFAQTLARDVARRGVRVYTIAPGVVDTGMGTQGLSTEQQSSVAEGLTMGRHVAAAEIAELAAFLATDRTPSLTGATLDLNGASYIR
ncbi:SDR family oxidoreductase [Plantibacter sp. ME-Dv--P-122b]|uniref:SDR family NAD(P)-dependent oxidoreductase n=1 Tax=Plantibacter sp. ME-Dv--P-122b TaxID=3040300 RepID=UPI002549FC08|nr:SDR family oxidoreductase [Plantibacter sp. ME-Dv--P-122b]